MPTIQHIEIPVTVDLLVIVAIAAGVCLITPIQRIKQLTDFIGYGLMIALFVMLVMFFAN